MGLTDYRRKRRFRRSSGQRQRGRQRRRADNEARFVVHTPGDDHYGLCLEIDGVLVSWEIPKDRRIARRTEDHPLEYAARGGVAVSDEGTYANATNHEMTECLERGHLSFHLCGQKLRGCYALTRIREGEAETWLLMKRKDNGAEAGHGPIDTQPESEPASHPPDEVDDLS